MYDLDAFSSSSSSSESEYNSGDDYAVGSKRKRSTNTRGQGKGKGNGKAKVVRKPTYIAQVTETATDVTNTSENTSKVEKADSHILARIRKAMTLATHPGTGEAEAKVAMRMATKLMQSQNLTQADLIANETEEERSTRAGQSTVAISSTQGKMVRNQRWYGIATSASCEAFDVQVYSESLGKTLHCVFYGLADNTVAAALAFEMLHNQVETWAFERKFELKGQTARNSYCIGVVERVLRDAEKENRRALIKAEEEEKKRIKEEEAARAAEISRLSVVVEPEPEPKVEEKKPKVMIEDIPEEDVRNPFSIDRLESDDSLGLDSPPSLDETDDDDDEMGLHADFDHRDVGANDLDLDALEQKVKIKSEQLDLSPVLSYRYTPESPVKSEPAVKPELKDELAAMNNDLATAPSWTSALQLRTFRDNAMAIGDNYLKDTGMKLYAGRKLKALKYDTAAYKKGWVDGEKVDLKRRKIED